jgi:protein-S-isoprenylcysteine O-methyltransferase Ste14
MSSSSTTTLRPGEPDPDALTRAGRWLFGRRTWLPLPIAAALLLLPAPYAPRLFSTPLEWVGVLVVLSGELLRIWAVHHIGVISRTRSDRLGPLVATGPFSLVRNPLYLGNILLWVGFSCSARLVWLAPIVLALLALEYHAIVRWEERLLEARFGDGYRAYAARVPRWVPLLRLPTSGETAPFSWRQTFFSERGTLVAIAGGYALLWIKSNVS